MIYWNFPNSQSFLRRTHLHFQIVNEALKLIPAHLLLIYFLERHRDVIGLGNRSQRHVQ